MKAQPAKAFVNHKSLQALPSDHRERQQRLRWARLWRRDSLQQGRCSWSVR